MSGFYGHTQHWCFGRICRERAKRDRGGLIEPILLHDDRWSRLPWVVLDARNCPDLSALHKAESSETASTNCCSAAACSLAATGLDCLRAAATKERARTSGTPICTGRRPWARRRSQCNLTLSRDHRTGYM